MGFMSGQNYHDIVSKYYEIPVISIRVALWHEYFESRERSPLWQASPREKSHPSRKGQYLIADIVAMELMAFRRDPPTLLRDRKLFPLLLLSVEKVEKNTAALMLRYFARNKVRGYSTRDDLQPDVSQRPSETSVVVQTYCRLDI
jgi:hypothetical protein